MNELTYYLFELAFGKAAAKLLRSLSLSVSPASREQAMADFKALWMYNSQPTLDFR
jgi:hypothetical protein